MHGPFYNAYGQGDDTTPTGLSKLRVVELSEKKKQRTALDYVIGGTFFEPRSIFDPIMRGQRSNFREVKFSAYKRKS